MSSFREPPYSGTIASFGATIESISDGYARLRYPFDPRWCNPKGTIQGGIYAVFLDDAMGYAMVGHYGDSCRFSTLTLIVSYLQAVDRGDVIAEGRVVHAGRRIAYLEGEIRNDQGNLVVRGTSIALLHN